MKLRLAFLLTLTAVAHAAAKPNIVIIFTDDLGYGNVSAYYASDVQTPNSCIAS